MKHWHQCVKYTLPQCSFQFIFLLVSYVCIKKEQPKRKRLQRETKACQVIEADIFVILSMVQEGPLLIPMSKYQLHFLLSQAALPKRCHDRAQRDSCGCCCCAPSRTQSCAQAS